MVHSTRHGCLPKTAAHAIRRKRLPSKKITPNQAEERNMAVPSTDFDAAINPNHHPAHPLPITQAAVAVAVAAARSPIARLIDSLVLDSGGGSHENNHNISGRSTTTGSTTRVEGARAAKLALSPASVLFLTTMESRDEDEAPTVFDDDESFFQLGPLFASAEEDSSSQLGPLFASAEEDAEHPTGNVGGKAIQPLALSSGPVAESCNHLILSVLSPLYCENSNVVNNDMNDISTQRQHDDDPERLEQALSEHWTYPRTYREHDVSSKRTKEKGDQEGARRKSRRRVVYFTAVLALIILAAMLGVTVGFFSSQNSEDSTALSSDPLAPAPMDSPASIQFPGMPPSPVPASSVPTINTGGLLAPAPPPTPSLPSRPAPAPAPSMMPACISTLDRCATSYLELVSFTAALRPGDTLAICGTIAMENVLIVSQPNITICCSEGATCTLSAGSAQNLIVRAGNVTLQGLLFQGGDAMTDSGNGGNVYVDANHEGGVEILDCSFLDGIAKNGGNLHIQDASSVFIANSRFSFGFAENGAGVSIKNTPNVTIYASSFDSNRCSDQGGGLRVYTTSDNYPYSSIHVAVSMSHFSSNEAARGAGFFLNNFGTLRLFMEDSYFGENRAFIRGGVGYIFLGDDIDGGDDFDDDASSINSNIGYISAFLARNGDENNTAASGDCSNLFVALVAISECLSITDEESSMIYYPFENDGHENVFSP